MLRRFVSLACILFLLIAARPALAAAPATETGSALAPLLNAPPTISLNVPSVQFIGEDVSFTVTFDNNDPAPGYGPIIDLIIPATGADGDDGLGTTTISASYLGTPFTAGDTMRILTFDALGEATHPFFRDSSGAYITVTGNPGDKLVVLRLPFGSFTSDQPPATVNVTVNMSNFADLGVPLTVQARGGYEFGYTPLDDWCCGDAAYPNAISGWTSDSVTPGLFTLAKSYSGPEDEAASGPNFRTYYPIQYTVTVDIASGQSISSLVLNDVLPDNLQYYDLIASNPAGAICNEPVAAPPPPESPGGTLTCSWGAPVSGSASLTFDFYVPLRDAGAASVIDPNSGDDVISCDNASLDGSWTPLDPRDSSVALDTLPDANPPGCEHTLTDKSLAIQKSATVIGGGQPAPGAVIAYSLEFQVSDFFVFRDVIVTDVISDGQHFDSSFTPTLAVNGNGYTLGAASIAAANYDVICNYTGGPGGECTADDPNPNDGKTTLIFRVSDEIITRGQDGRMIGGCVPVGGTGGGDPNCSTYNDGATTATLVFRTVVQDEFTDDHLIPPHSGDPSVDQGDVLNNDVTVNGALLSTSDASTPTGQDESDDSGASLTIGTGALSKEIYAVNGAAPGSPVEVKPGDEVTYRITYVMPTGDEENLRFEDYLPLPVFDVSDPDADGAPGPAWVFDDVVSGAAPATGRAKFAPSDTFRAYSGIVPTITTNAANNRLTFTYDDFDGPTEQQYTVDILFTVTVSAEPFADRLYLTNQAHAYEGSTNAGEASADAIVQLILTEPVLTSTKGIIWTSDMANDTFSPATTGPVTFLDPTNAPRWSGTINSTNLAANPIDSDVSGVDAGDIVTFAITIENSGTSLKGAFDITPKDTLPDEYQIPAGGLNLQVYYGDGSGPISYTYNPSGGACTGSWPGDPCGPDGLSGTPDDLFGDGIQLVDPVGQGVCSAHDPNLGNNIILITFDLQLRDTVTPGDIVNTSSLTNYAGEEGGPNHLPQDQQDAATSTVVTSMTKELVSTEINQTYSIANSNTQAVIGEIATYEVEISIPEGQVPAAGLVDTLDGGLAFVDCLSVTRSSGDLTTDYGAGDFSDMCNPGVNPTISAVGGQNGRRATWNLGTIANANRDDATLETLTFVYRVVFLNVSGNQNNGQRNNAAVFSYTGGSVSDSAPNVQIIEPSLDLTKAVNPPSADAGDLVTYTVTLRHAVGSSADAFDVTLSDPLPTCPGGEAMLQGAIITNVTDSAGLVDSSYFELVGSDATGWTLQTRAGPPAVTFDMPFSATRTISISVAGTLCYSVFPTQVLTNTGTVYWTSLDGDVTDRSTFNADSDERSGADGVGGALNDYADAGSVGFTVNNVDLTKIIIATSEDDSSTPDVLIGEVVRYRVAVVVPEGTSPTMQVRDLLPNGMVFLNDGSAKVAFVSGAVGACPGSATMSSSTLGTAPWVCGDETNVGSITPTYSLPAGAITNGSSPGNPFGEGHDPWFDLGTITNSDSDSNQEFVVLEYNALVMNLAGNQDGANLANRYQVWVGGSQISESTDAIVTVKEAGLTLDKTHSSIGVDVDAGDTITYTVTIRNESGAPTNSHAVAYDARFVDSLPAPFLSGLTLVSVTLDGGPAGEINNSAGNTLDITIPRIPLDSVVVITYRATVDISVTPGQAIDNTGNLTWTSLPGPNGSSGNATGSDTPGAAGSETGERDGSGGVNDYAVSDTVPLGIGDPSFNKSLEGSSANHTAGAALAIGETVTFGLIVTLPEGTTPALRVVDDLPPGLAYVDGSYEVVTQTSPPAACGSLTANFGGSVPAPTLTANPGVGGADVTFDFGSITTNGDNDPDNNTFLICFEAVVLNEVGNQQSPPPLSNNATMTVGGVDYGDSEEVNIVEPALSIAKSISDSQPAPGQVVTFTLTITHDGTSTADAFDALVSDDLPAGLSLDLASVTATPSGGVSGVSDNSSGNRLELFVASFPQGGSLTVTYQATVAAAFGTVINNTAYVTWTSLSGTDTNERTGADGVGGALNDYAAASGASLSANKDMSKALVGDTPEANTTSPQVTIGEVLTYRIVLTIPPGLTEDITLTDSLDAGLAFVGCTSLTPSSAALTTNVSGSFTSDFSPICASPTVNPLPPLGDPNYDADASPGRQVVFYFADVVNLAGASETLTLDYRVVVLDITANQDGDSLTNSAVWNWAAGSLQKTAPDALTIVEPDLTLDKSADVQFAWPGSTITFRLTLGHSANSNSDAFDVILTDVIPADLEYVPGSVNVVSGPGPSSDAYDAITRTLTLTWDTFPLFTGPERTESVVEFQAIMGNLRPGQAVTNTANVEWSSILGDWNVIPNFNVNSHERRYDPTNPADVYALSDSFTIEVPLLPDTGFAPGRVTPLPPQPAGIYQPLSDTWLEIPSLGVRLPIVGVPQGGEGWDLTWLWDQAGWLEGSAYPTHAGNSAITAHVYLPNGQPGPFLNLGSLRWGEQIIVHLGAQRYIYEVRQVRQVSPYSLSVLRHEEYPWLTLITCREYDEKTKSYRYRIVVRAVLIEVE